MFNFNDESVKEEIYKCSKCGQCRSVCPVFISLKNEIYSPRGRFIALNNYFFNSKLPNKSLIKNLDKCLSCNLCKRFCPSNIDSAGIFSYIKKQFGFKYSILDLGFLFRFHLLKEFFFSPGFFCKNKFNLSSVSSTSCKNILYFQGCLNKYANSNDKYSSLKILSDCGFNIVKISPNCCGYPLLADGKFNKFTNNIKKIEKELNSNIDYIVCSCDSCFETLKSSGSEIILSKLKRFDELVNLKDNCSDDNATLFKTLSRTDDFPSDLKTLDEKGLLSGGENLLFLKYPSFTKKIMSKTVKILSEIPADIIITTCNITNHALKKYVKNKKIMSLSEYLITCKLHR